MKTKMAAGKRRYVQNIHLKKIYFIQYLIQPEFIYSQVSALSGPNEFAEFYARLKQIKDFHRRHPGEVGS